MTYQPKLRECKYCSRSFTYENDGQTGFLYCSLECKREGRLTAVRANIVTPSSRLSPGDTGAISELIAATDLMRRGFHVFRALSPSASCDLILLDRTTATRVEVRTTRRNLNGLCSAPISVRDCGRYDILALVVDSKEVFYIPEFPGDEKAPVGDEARATVLRNRAA